MKYNFQAFNINFLYLNLSHMRQIQVNDPHLLKVV